MCPSFGVSVRSVFGVHYNEVEEKKILKRWCLLHVPCMRGELKEHIRQMKCIIILPVSFFF